MSDVPHIHEEPDDDETPQGDLLASEQPTDDAASTQTLRSKREKQLRSNAEIIMFWRSLLANAIGRKVLWDFLNNQCHIFEDRFACGPNGFPDPQATWFHAGEKSVGMRLYRTLLRTDLDGVREMHREYDSAFADPKPIPRRKRK